MFEVRRYVIVCTVSFMDMRLTQMEFKIKMFFYDTLLFANTVPHFETISYVIKFTQ